MRRKTDWPGVAAMARKTPGQWRLHTTFVAADAAFLKHARRRAIPLRPSTDGRFEFTTANHGEDQLGHPVFDVFIRFVPEREEDHEEDRRHA